MLFFGERFGGGAVIVVVSVYMFLFVAFGFVCWDF